MQIPTVCRRLKKQDSAKEEGKVCDGGMTQITPHKETFICDQCDDQFNCIREYRLHLKSHAFPTIYKCEICSKVFLKKCNLSRHQSVHEARDHTCEVCGKKYSNKVYLEEHLRGHSGMRPYKCATCGAQFSAKAGLNHHMKLHDRDRTPVLVCEICGKEFTRQGLWGHMKTHNKEYTCPTCERRFATPSALKRHTKWVHESHPQLSCHLCHQRFDFKSNLDRHTLNEHSYLNGRFIRRKPFPCERCSQSFHSRTRLESHLEAKHAAKDTVACPVCGKVLSGKSAVNYHMRTHTGERPHKCSHCPKAFTRPDLLKKHSRVHTGQRYLCLDCGKSFTSKHYLTEHSWTHDLPNTNASAIEYGCGRCRQTFPNANLLEEHLEIHVLSDEFPADSDLSLEFTQGLQCLLEPEGTLNALKTCDQNELKNEHIIDGEDKGTIYETVTEGSEQSSNSLEAEDFNVHYLKEENDWSEYTIQGCEQVVHLEFMCSSCFQTFESGELLEKHAVVHGALTGESLSTNCPMTPQIEDDQSHVSGYDPEICSSIFGNQSELDKHSWPDKSNEVDYNLIDALFLTCPCCSLAFFTQEELDGHDCNVFHISRPQNKAATIELL